MRFNGVSSEVYVYAVPTQGIPEIVRMNRDGSFTVLLDEAQPRERQLELLSHALNHIAHEEDWYPGADVDAIERRCHAEEEKRRQI